MNNSSYSQVYFRRSWILAGALVAWLLVVLSMLFYTAIDQDGRYRNIVNSIAMRSGKLPALRGTIYDRNGEKLAWSNYYIDLYWDNEKTIPTSLLQQIQNILPQANALGIKDDLGVALKKGVPIKAITGLVPMLRSKQGLFLHLRPERLQLAIPELRAVLGAVENGRGISGLEKEYDYMLFGKEGEVKNVLLDRAGNFILSEETVVIMPKKGQDLLYWLSTEELIQRSRQDGDKE